MRELQPSHVGRPGEHIRAHLSAPRLKRRRETPCALPPKPKERPLAQPGTGFREGPSAPSSPWAGVLFVCFSDFVSASFLLPKGTPR